jgi:hypothetical protein
MARHYFFGQVSIVILLGYFELNQLQLSFEIKFATQFRPGQCQHTILQFFPISGLAQFCW